NERIGTPGTQASAAIADFDRDGRLDIVLQDDLDGDGFRVLRNDPSATDGFRLITKVPSRIEVPNMRVATGDVNGDGWTDVVTLTGPAPSTPLSHLFIWFKVPGPH